MSRSWVKLSTTILDHFELDAVESDAFKVFIKCLALAGAVDDDGRLGSEGEVAYRLRIPADELRLAVDRLGGRIAETDGVLWVRDWSEHQAAGLQHLARGARALIEQRQRGEENIGLEIRRDRNVDELD